MKKIYLSIILVGILFTAGCAENQTKIGEGAGLGGLLGATAGGIVGHQSGNDMAGILIGGAVGAAGGAMVGSQMPKPNAYAAAAAEPISQVTIQQIVDWTHQGVISDTIISRIKSTGSVYYLNADDVRYLRKEGVSQRVVEAMLAK